MGTSAKIECVSLVWLVVSHVVTAVLLIVELHVNIDLHQVGLVRISLASEQGCAVSDKIGEVSLS